jgi:CPA2 family monovalent cation:H+ antiporter-2
LVQDAAVVPLVLMVVLLAPGSVAGGATLGPLARLGMGLLALIGLVGFERFMLPRLLRVPSLSRNRELPILFAVVVAVGAAWLSHKLGASPSLGAFLAGVVLGDSPVSLQVRADVASLKTLFVTLFFGSVGLLGDPAWMVHNAVPVVAAILLVIVGKTLLVWPLGRLAGLSHRHAIAAGLCLAQVGEFSFVIADAARGTGGPESLLSPDLFALLVSTTIGSLMLTPFLVRSAPALGRAVERQLGGSGSGGDVPAAPRSGHIVVVGFGPAGQAVADSVAAAGRDVEVVDISPSLVSQARDLGFRAWLGDASAGEVIESACVESASAVVVTLPDYRAAVQVIQTVRAQAPATDLIARARYHRYATELTRAGATAVIDEEEEVGRQLARTIHQIS